MSFFLCPYRDPDTGARLVRVGVPAVPPDLPDHLASIVLISPAVDLHGLTPRELEIIGLLVEAWPNGRIAATLVVAERTVATHLEHILDKLQVATRTAAAALALRLGRPQPGHGGGRTGRPEPVRAAHPSSRLPMPPTECPSGASGCGRPGSGRASRSPCTPRTGAMSG